MGVAKTEWFINDVLKHYKTKTVKAITLSCLLVQGNIQRRMRKKGGGRVYKTPGTSYALHTASRAGEPPASWSGRLAGGMRMRVGLKNDPMGGTMVVGQVGSDIKYLLYLEKSTLKMKARPVMGSTLYASGAGIMKLFKEVGATMG